MAALHNVMSDVLSIIESRDPLPKGGGKGGSSGGSSSGSKGGSNGSSASTSSSTSSTSSTSSSSKGSSGSSSSSTSGTASSSSSTTNTKSGTTSNTGTTSTYRGGAFVFIPGVNGGSGGFRTSNGGYLPLWAFILILVASFIVFLFLCGFTFYLIRAIVKKKRFGTGIRWGRVFWGATKVALFLWIPIGIYRLTCGRNRKKDKGSYRKIEEGGRTEDNRPQAAFNIGNGDSSGKPLLYGGNNSSPAYAPAPAFVPFGASVVQPPLASPPPPYLGAAGAAAAPPSKNVGAAASYYAMFPPSAASTPGAPTATLALQQPAAHGGSPVPMSVPPPSSTQPQAQNATYVPAYAPGPQYYGPGAV